jgi:hypothetical protein
MFYGSCEPVTVHDWRPSHRVQPDWLIAAEAKAKRAYQALDELVERRIATDVREPEALAEAMQRCEDAERRVQYCRDCWLNGREP